jgi:hypothetical protein
VPAGLLLIFTADAWDLELVGMLGVFISLAMPLARYLIKDEMEAIRNHPDQDDDTGDLP